MLKPRRSTATRPSSSHTSISNTGPAVLPCRWRTHAQPCVGVSLTITRSSSTKGRCASRRPFCSINNPMQACKAASSTPGWST